MPGNKRRMCVGCFLLISTLAFCQIKVSVVTDESVSSSKAVVSDLRSKLNSHPKQFSVVSNKDSDQGLIVTVDCLPRETTEPFVCFYTSHYAGGTCKTFMGGGIYAAQRPDQVADNFLGSIAQDVAERWNEIVRSNAIESLESCLFLTQSSCKVPGILVPELKSSIINLSQYLQKGGLKK
jgi:hypothetical protein